jgi:hypothetical protein
MPLRHQVPYISSQSQRLTGSTANSNASCSCYGDSVRTEQKKADPNPGRLFSLDSPRLDPSNQAGPDDLQWIPILVSPQGPFYYREAAPIGTPHQTTSYPLVAIHEPP